MNKFVKQQLQKCKIPSLIWSDSTRHIHIPMEKSMTNSAIKIQIKNYILNEPPNFTLSHDWNNDTIPPETMMYVTIIETKGRMTKVAGKGVITGIPWEGWLPAAGFEEL